MARELVTGIAALALAAAYFAAADALPVSLLSDEVGADGVPKAIAVALGLCGLMQLARAALRRAPAAAGDETAAGAKPHLRALGLLGIAIAYVVVTPHVGYLVATAALLFAAAAYAGQRLSLTLAAVSLAGAVVLWLSFVKLLGVAMPPAPFV